MKVKNSKGEIKEVVIKANDSIPAGAIVDFDGDVVPEGYEQVEDEIEDKINSLSTNKINYKTASWNKSVSLSMPIRWICTRVSRNIISICFVEKWNRVCL